MSEWVNRKPVPGDQIRVNRGLYCHHGIYVGGGAVIHFGMVDSDGMENSKDVSVCRVTIDQFLRGGELEVRKYSKEEKKDLRSQDEIVEKAYASLGEKGYNLITNNCENFSNRCAFRHYQPGQVEDIKDKIFEKLKR